jgi:hypothetical protein
MKRPQVTPRVMLCAPATFRQRRSTGRPTPSAPRIIMVDPHGWAKRRRITHPQSSNTASVGLAALGMKMSVALPSLQQRWMIDATAMVRAMKQYAHTYRRPLLGGLGLAVGTTAAFVIAAHHWHASTPVQPLPAMASVAHVAAPLPLSPVSSVAVPKHELTNISTPLPAPKTTLGLADDGTIVVVAPPHPSNMDGFNLDITTPGNLWAKAGARYHIDPVLIYAIALVETRGVQPDGSVAPSPWIVRINGHLHNGTRAESEHAIVLANLMAVPVQDVGIMQVYYPMHRDIEPDPIRLLNPARNIDVGTGLLRKAMQESSDPVLRIGYYHSHDATLARGYGQLVLNVYHELKTAMARSPSSAMALASKVTTAHEGS